jgi:predicted glutamine amidotransferase
MAVIYEAEDKSYYKVNYGTSRYPYSFSKVFMDESEATNFATEYTDRGNKPVLLEE